MNQHGVTNFALTCNVFSPPNRHTNCHKMYHLLTFLFLWRLSGLSVQLSTHLNYVDFILDNKLSTSILISIYLKYVLKLVITTMIYLIKLVKFAYQKWCGNDECIGLWDSCLQLSNEFILTLSTCRQSSTKNLI